jgi:hypothetical protein
VAFKLLYNPPAVAELTKLTLDGSLKGRERAVKKALAHLEQNPRHPGLHTHKMKGQRCPHDGDLWQAYAENKRPGAYRITFCYPPGVPDTILIVDIMVHPD